MNKFKILIIAATAIALSGCGYSSRDNEVIGQVKRVMNNTPMICGDYYDADISMGVMRNGVGSVSKEDMWVVIPGDKVAEFKKLAESGEPVKVVYDIKRLAFCTTDHVARSIEVVK